MGASFSSHFQPAPPSRSLNARDGDVIPLARPEDGPQRSEEWRIEPPENKEQEQGEQQMPRISQAQMRALIRSGLKPDLCLMPYQMPRMDNGDDLSPIPSKPRPTIRIKNDINLHKTSVSLIRDTEFPHRYALSFKFDCMCETDVTVYYCCTEIVDQRNTSVRFIPASPDLVSTGRFGAGKSHHYIQTLEESLDTSNLSEQQFKYNPQQRYWPIIIHLQATQPHDPLLRTDDHKSPTRSPLSHSTSIEALHAQIQHTDQVIRARSQTTFAQMARTGADQALQAKVMKQKIKVAGQSYELQEIYGMEAKNDDTGRPISPQQISSEEVGMAEAQECVVCMTEPRDTTIFPCRHMCLCAACAEIVRTQTNRCPICRCVVQSLFKMPTLVSSHSVENLSSQRRNTTTSITSTSPIPEENVSITVNTDR